MFFYYFLNIKRVINSPLQNFSLTLSHGKKINLGSAPAKRGGV